MNNQKNIEKSKERRFLINVCVYYYTMEMQMSGIYLDINFAPKLFNNKTLKELKNYILTSKKLAKISGNTKNLYILQ